MHHNMQTLLCSILVITLLAACSDSSDRRNNGPETPIPPEPVFLPVSTPAVSAPPETGEIVLISTSFDFESVGFVQEEFFLSGTATSFTNLNDFGRDGRWEAEPSERAEYKTRVVVYRP